MTLRINLDYVAEALARGKIETVEYQARMAADHRNCGRVSCRSEFPALPSRWCSGCLISALLESKVTK